MAPCLVGRYWEAGATCIFGRCENQTCVCDPGFEHDNGWAWSTACDVKSIIKRVFETQALVLAVLSLITSLSAIRRMNHKTPRTLKLAVVVCIVNNVLFLMACSIIFVRRDKHSVAFAILVFVGFTMTLHVINLASSAYLSALVKLQSRDLQDAFVKYHRAFFNVVPTLEILNLGVNVPRLIANSNDANGFTEVSVQGSTCLALITVVSVLVMLTVMFRFDGTLVEKLRVQHDPSIEKLRGRLRSFSIFCFLSGALGAGSIFFSTFIHLVHKRAPTAILTLNGMYVVFVVNLGIHAGLAKHSRSNRRTSQTGRSRIHPLWQSRASIARESVSAGTRKAAESFGAAAVNL